VLVLVGIVASPGDLVHRRRGRAPVANRRPTAGRVLQLARDELLITGPVPTRSGITGGNGYSCLKLVISWMTAPGNAPMVDQHLGRGNSSLCVGLNMKQEGERRAAAQTAGWEPNVKAGNTGRNDARRDHLGRARQTSGAAYPDYAGKALSRWWIASPEIAGCYLAGSAGGHDYPGRSPGGPLIKGGSDHSPQ